ncbi:MAG: hypothetical protein ACE5J9_11750 [Methanosarcinales archaeon]
MKDRYGIMLQVSGHYNVTLSDLGVEEDNIETMVKDAQKYMASFIELAPVKANTSDLVKLYKDSFI